MNNKMKFGLITVIIAASSLIGIGIVVNTKKKMQCNCKRKTLAIEEV